MKEMWVRSLGQEDSPWSRKWKPTLIFLSGKTHGQRSLVGYSPWGHKWEGYDLAIPCVHAKLLQSCPTLCNSRDCSLPGSSVHGILQARILQWVAISFIQGIFPIQGSNLGLLHCRQVVYHLSHQGSPIPFIVIVKYWLCPLFCTICTCSLLQSTLCLLTHYPYLPLPTSLSHLVTTHFFSVSLFPFWYIY